VLYEARDGRDGRWEGEKARGRRGERPQWVAGRPGIHGRLPLNLLRAYAAAKIAGTQRRPEKRRKRRIVGRNGGQAAHQCCLYFKQPLEPPQEGEERQWALVSEGLRNKRSTSPRRSRRRWECVDRRDPPPTPSSPHQAPQQPSSERRRPPCPPPFFLFDLVALSLPSLLVLFRRSSPSPTLHLQRHVRHALPSADKALTTL
jgi:hypothetical protein